MDLEQNLPIHRLFTGVARPAMDRALAQSHTVNCVKSSVIYSPHDFQRCLAVLLQGSVRVTKETLVVSNLHAGDLFGAAALFNDREDYAVTLTALSDCMVLFFPQAAIRALLAESPAFAENYVRYLSERIRFLSSRLDAVAAGTTTRRLAQYLLANLDEHNTVTSSATALCKQLGISRASLYRAFDVLEQDGAIRRSQKQIQVIDPDKLQH